MQLQIRTENIDLTPKTKALIDQKLSSDLENLLMDFSEDSKEAQVQIEKRTRWGVKINFDMWLPGKKHIYAEEEGENLTRLITILQEKIEAQIREHTGKLQEKK